MAVILEITCLKWQRYMVLIKENSVKNRSVYKEKNFIRKYWHDQNEYWIENHVKILDQLIPGYVISKGKDHKGCYIDFKILPGTCANEFEHTDTFIKKIYEFCLKNVKETSPYAHGDWVLSNMFVDGDDILLCDWDNVGVYDEVEIIEKLKKDLLSAFGNRFLEVIR